MSYRVNRPAVVGVILMVGRRNGVLIRLHGHAGYSFHEQY
jgi:hypothetical protein